jgi:hypothetical protein
MISKDEFNVRKLELVNLYKEYAELLEHFATEDLNNFKKLDRLSNVYHAVMKCQAEFTQFIADKLDGATE